MWGGSCRLIITCADMPAFLTEIQKKNIFVHNANYLDELSVELMLPRSALPVLEQIVINHGGRVQILHQTGLANLTKSILKRPLLLGLIGMILFLSLFLPTRVLFVKVQGNQLIPVRYILDEAEKCGICFGASRNTVRSEKVKNALMEAIPELSWVGVNTNGFVASISVKEKSIPPEEKTAQGICSIVASRDGVIMDMTVIKGVGMCKAGQSVKMGQVLISGYEDLGILMRATAAAGEIKAQTLRQIEIITPVYTAYRGEEISRQTVYSLIIGKKQIKFYKDSGISDTSCVKIYRENNICLPGGLCLPLCLLKEERIFYESNEIPVAEESYEWLHKQARSYLLDQMIAGSVLQEEAQLHMLDNACLLIGNYACLEMIGQVQYEEIITQYGKNS